MVSLVSICIVLVLAEIGLRVVGYEAYFVPIVVKDEQGEAVADDKAIIPDAELIWRFNPGAMFNGRRINSLGHIGREVDPQKEPGTKRVICMGDSCSGQGMPPYSGYLHQMLTNTPPTAERWESFNMAVHGYSSAQGLRLFQKRGKELEPDIVTLYFGWNDHWLRDRPDSNMMAVEVGPVMARVLVRLQNLCIFQLFASAIQPSGRLAWSKSDERGLRVPVDEYEATLETFVKEIRDAGAVPLLLTAPRAEKLSAILVHNGQTDSVENAVRLHDDYAAVTRRVAQQQETALLDLAEEFSRPENAHLFSKDGVHFTTEGLIHIAELLHAKIDGITTDLH